MMNSIITCGSWKKGARRDPCEISRQCQIFWKHQTDTACTWLVRHSRGGGDRANCIHLSRLSGGPATQVFGEASRASQQHDSGYGNAQTTIPTNIHTANRIFTNILIADKHNIPKGKMHINCRLLPEDIVCKITQRNNIRTANTCDPALKLLNEEITFDIQKHKQNIWKEHLDAHWDDRHNTHTNHFHNIQRQNSNYTQTHCELFHQTIHKHATHKTNRHINRATPTYKEHHTHYFSGPRGYKTK